MFPMAHSAHLAMASSSTRVPLALTASPPSHPNTTIAPSPPPTATAAVPAAVVGATDTAVGTPLRTRTTSAKPSHAPCAPSFVWLFGLFAARSATARIAHTATARLPRWVRRARGTWVQASEAPRRLRLVMLPWARTETARQAALAASALPVERDWDEEATQVVWGTNQAHDR